MTELTVSDLELIQVSLRFTLCAFREYTDYPSYEFKQQRIAEAKAVNAKISKMEQDARNRQGDGRSK